VWHGVILREQRPLALLAERLQPVDAQLLRERRARVARQERADVLRVRRGEAELEPPVLDVGREVVARDLRLQRDQRALVALLECRLRGEEFGIARRRGRDGEQGCRKDGGCSDHVPILREAAGVHNRTMPGGSKGGPDGGAEVPHATVFEVKRHSWPRTRLPEVLC
jgi:hypothetical protein